MSKQETHAQRQARLREERKLEAARAKAERKATRSRRASLAEQTEELLARRRAQR